MNLMQSNESASTTKRSKPPLIPLQVIGQISAATAELVEEHFPDGVPVTTKAGIKLLRDICGFEVYDSFYCVLEAGLSLLSDDERRRFILLTAAQLIEGLVFTPAVDATDEQVAVYAAAQEAWDAASLKSLEGAGV